MENWDDSKVQIEFDNCTVNNVTKVHKFSFNKILSIIMLSLLVIMVLTVLFQAIEFNPFEFASQTLYNLKPYSTLSFEKLETARPKGTICIMEGNIDEVENKVIVFHDNQLDIYQSLSLKECIKTITFPGKIEMVKSNYRDPGYHDWLYLADKGVNNQERFSFVLIVVYNNNGKRIFSRMRIPTNRFIIWNVKYSTSNDIFKENALQQLNREMERFKAKEKIMNEIEAALDEQPKNPYDFLSTCYWTELGDRNFLTMDFENTYMTSSDGKTLYEIGSDKIEKEIFRNDKPCIWSYYYYGYANSLVFLGYDGENIITSFDTQGEGFKKLDTFEQGIVDKSFFTLNATNKSYGYLRYFLWNGKHYFALEADVSKPFNIGGSNFQPISSSLNYINTVDGKTVFINYQYEKTEGFFNVIDFEVKTSTSLSTIKDGGYLENVSLAFEKNSNPVILYKDFFKDNITYFDIINVDQPVEEFYPFIENGKIVFYLLNLKTIYRWESSNLDFSNLKPRIIQINEKYKIPFDLNSGK